MQDTVISSRVTLTVPGELEYIRVVRLASIAVASQHGLDVVALENLRVAVSELASLVLEITDGDLAVTFDIEEGLSGSYLRITGRAPCAGYVDLAADGLTDQILRAVVASYELGTSIDEAWFSCTTLLPLVP